MNFYNTVNKERNIFFYKFSVGIQNNADIFEKAETKMLKWFKKKLKMIKTKTKSKN